MTARNVNPIGYYQMMAEPGSSGGAVLNSKNEIVGVHAFRVDSGEYKTYHLNTMAEIRGSYVKKLLIIFYRIDGIVRKLIAHELKI